MRVWEFFEANRWVCLKDRAEIRRGDVCLCNERVEFMPHRDKPNRHPKLSWADEHVKNIRFEANLHPAAMHGYTGYTITIELFEEA